MLNTTSLQLIAAQSHSLSLIDAQYHLLFVFTVTHCHSLIITQYYSLSLIDAQYHLLLVIPCHLFTHYQHHLPIIIIILLVMINFISHDG